MNGFGVGLRRIWLHKIIKDWVQEVFGRGWGTQAVVRKSQGLGPSVTGFEVVQKRIGPQTDWGIVKEDLTRK